MMVDGIHKRAVAAAAFVSWAISVGWYGVFGRTWAALVNRPPVWTFEPSKVVLGLGFNALLALGVAVVLRSARERGAARGAMWGAALTLFFMLPAHSGKWTWQDKPLLLVIDTGAHLLSLVAAGLIIGHWSRDRRDAR